MALSDGWRGARGGVQWSSMVDRRLVSWTPRSPTRAQVLEGSSSGAEVDEKFGVILGVGKL